MSLMDCAESGRMQFLLNGVHLTYQWRTVKRWNRETCAPEVIDKQARIGSHDWVCVRFLNGFDEPVSFTEADTVSYVAEATAEALQEKLRSANMAVASIRDARRS